MVNTDASQDWRDNRTVLGRRADIERGVAAERARWEAKLTKMIADRRAQMARLEAEIAELHRQRAKELADV